MEVGTSNAFISIINNSDILALIGDSNLNGHNWCMDSGASDHMCHEKEQFDYLENTTGKKVKIGDGRSLELEGIGKITLNAWNGEQWLKTELSNVLYVFCICFL